MQKRSNKNSGLARLFASLEFKHRAKNARRYSCSIDILQDMDADCIAGIELWQIHFFLLLILFY
jgi:hypothetical protein